MKASTIRAIWLVFSAFFGFGILVTVWHWTIFLFGGTVITACIYFAGIQLTRVVQSLRTKSFKTAIKYFLYFIVLIALSGCIWLVAVGSGVFTGDGIPHLRTNVFTTECSLNQWNDQANPWYYRRGCDVSTEEKIQLLKDDYRFEFIQVRCGAGDNYGGHLKWDEVTCTDLFE